MMLFAMVDVVPSMPLVKGPPLPAKTRPGQPRDHAGHASPQLPRLALAGPSGF